MVNGHWQNEIDFFLDLAETLFPIETPHYFPNTMLDGSDAGRCPPRRITVIAGDKSRESLFL